MDLLELVDKQSKHQLHIFQFLLAHERQVEIERLFAAFSLSTPTIQKEVLQLKEKLQLFHPKAELMLLEKTTLRLCLPDDFLLDEFLYEMYYSESLEVQLLDTLYLVQELSITKLTLAFQISEASLFRRLKQLNTVLDDFELGYKNRQLLGKAEDVQLFYYHFYRQVFPFRLLKQRFYRESFDQLLTILETQLAFSFSAVERVELMLWLSITEKQLDIRTTRRYSTVTFFPFKEELRFKQMEQIFFRFSSRYAMQWPREAIEWFYVFLQAEAHIDMSDAFLTKMIPLFTDLHKILEHDLATVDQVYLAQTHLYVAYQKTIWTTIFAQGESLSDQDQESFYQIMEKIETYAMSRLTTTKWRYLDEAYFRIVSSIRIKQKLQLEFTGYLDIEDPWLYEETVQLLAECSRLHSLALPITTELKQAQFKITTNAYPTLTAEAESLPSVYLADKKWTHYTHGQLRQLLDTLQQQRKEVEG